MSKESSAANGIPIAPGPGQFRNPMISGFNPDPSIVRVEGDFFLATSTFEYYPGVPIYHSKDLVQWSLIGHCLTRPSQLTMRSCEASMGIFAPTLRFWRGRYYMTTMAVHKKGEVMQDELARGFYVSTDNIWDSSSWTDPIYYDVLGIDQDLFFDDTTGKVWLSLAKRLDEDSPTHRGYPIGVYVGEIDLETGNSLSDMKLVRLSSEGNGIAEGPHIFKRGQYYYMITAEGGTEVEHQEWVMRSTNGPTGPWELGEKDVINPMIFNGDHSEIRQTGHMDMVEGIDGQWWAVFLAVRPVHVEDGDVRLSQLGRETFLAPVEWHNDWPVVNKRRPITINMDAPGLLRTSEQFGEELKFAPGTDLARQGWYRMRTPVKADFELTDNTLTLYGSPYSITADEAPTMFLRKQLSFQGKWTVQIEASPQNRHEAGIAIWWSKFSYGKIAIRGTSEGRSLVYRFPTLDNNEFQEVNLPLTNDGLITIHVEVTYTGYSFYYEDEHTSKKHFIGHLSSALLVRTRSFDSIMTGTHLALFASGTDNQGSRRPAHFRNVTWNGLRAGGQ